MEARGERRECLIFDCYKSESLRVATVALQSIPAGASA